MQLIILAAGMGTRLMPITAKIPKCLVPLRGKTILEWQIEVAQSIGIEDIIVITGFRSEAIQIPGITKVHNPQYKNSNMVYSLFCAESIMKPEFVISYGDIVYSPEILSRLIKSEAPISVVVDDKWKQYWNERFDNPLEDAESLKITNESIYSIGQKPNDLKEIESQYIGLTCIKHSGKKAFLDTYKEFNEKNPMSARHLYMTDLLQMLADQFIKLTPVHINRGWVEIDSISDLSIAEKHFHTIIQNEKSL